LRSLADATWRNFNVDIITYCEENSTCGTVIIRFRILDAKQKKFIYIINLKNIDKYTFKQRKISRIYPFKPWKIVTIKIQLSGHLEEDDK